MATSLFINNRASVDRHGVFAEEVTPPPVIATGATGIVGMVGKFPWGPDDRVVQPTDPADRDLIFAPPGMDRTMSGVLAYHGKAWADLRIVRALGSAAAKATADLPDAVPATIAVLDGLYKGAAGNSISWQVGTATDGNAQHFNLTVTVTGESGTTTEVHENIDFSGSNNVIPPTLSASRLVKLTKSANGRPVNGTGSLAGGSDGSIDAARYLGTIGSPDYGLSLFEDDSEVEIVFADDCGNTDRAAVNAGLRAHVEALGDRVAVANGNSGVTTVANVKTDAALYSSTNVAYADPWYFKRDHLQTERLVNPAPLLACMMANNSPSTSPAYKGSEKTKFMGDIVRLETPRGSAIGGLTKAGVCTIMKKRSGGYAFEAGVLTIAPANPSKKNITRTRTGIYIAKNVTISLEDFTDAPNVESVQNEIIGAIDRFLRGMKDAKDRDPINNPFIPDYAFGDISAVNPLSSVQAGDFTIPCDVQIGASMERIFFSVRYGESVTITAS